MWTPAPKTSADALLELLLYAGGQVDRWIRSSSKDTPTKDERSKDKDQKRGSPFRHGAQAVVSLLPFVGRYIDCRMARQIYYAAMVDRNPRAEENAGREK